MKNLTPGKLFFYLPFSYHNTKKQENNIIIYCNTSKEGMPNVSKYKFYSITNNNFIFLSEISFYLDQLTPIKRK